MIAYEENSVLIFYVLIIFLIFLHACAVNGEVTSVICQHNFGRNISTALGVSTFQYCFCLLHNYLERTIHFIRT